MVTGRLAPTPSGRMHVGNVFSLLLAWLSARSGGGQILLRIEDLDPLRTGEPHTGQLLEDLLWLGLDWDGLDKRPAFTTAALGYDEKNRLWLQGRRGKFYDSVLEALTKKGLVYECFCSRAQLHAASAPHASDGSYVYDGRCRALTGAALAEKQKERSGALRLQVPDVDICFTDGLQGDYRENLARACGDFILRRSDGVFAYQLAATADDGAMGVTEVVRGRDLLSSTPRQIWLLQTLGYTPPRYVHVPLLLAPDGRRLAKRDKDLDLGALRQRGIAPQRVIGMLAHGAGLLDKPEPVRPADLICEFNWNIINKQDWTIEGEFL